MFFSFATSGSKNERKTKENKKSDIKITAHSYWLTETSAKFMNCIGGCIQKFPD
jgi:hypothetical protein